MTATRDDQYLLPGFFEPSSPARIPYDHDAFIEDCWFMARFGADVGEACRRLDISLYAFEQRRVKLRREGKVLPGTPPSSGREPPNALDFVPSPSWLAAHPDEDWRS